MLRWIADVLGVDIAIPDHTTLSRRGGGLTILPNRVDRDAPLHLLVDSTGLKIYGEGEWLGQKHGIRLRRRWRKLHLGVDADTHEIIASELTPDDIGDVSALPELLDQSDADVASLTADGAYDGEAVYDAVAERHPEASVIIPPRTTAIPSETATTQHSATDISRPSQTTGASAGSAAQATTAGAWSRLRCIGTRPSSSGVLASGLCPINGPKRRSDATRLTG